MLSSGGDRTGRHIGVRRSWTECTYARRSEAISRDLRVNQMIRIPQVRVVDEDGSQLGVMPTPQALAMAQERGYDLVEVAPMAAPPVVRFLDFGQFKYEATKREKEAKRKQRSVTFKEVRLKPKIATGDFDTRVRRAIQFLEEGDRLKVAVQFRGRELTHPEIGRNLLSKFADRIKDHGVVERAPLLEGKSMHITVASTHKPKVIEGPKHEGGSAAVDGAEPAPVTAGDGVAPEPAATPPAAAPAPVAGAGPATSEAVPAAEPPATAGRAAPKAPASKPVPASKPAATRTKTATSAPAETPAATTDSPTGAVRAAPKRAPRTTRATEPGAKAKAATTATTTGE
ncbi:MAG: translation initiation factor IF-3 [Candidatus Limnocylindrales bacterium]